MDDDEGLRIPLYQSLTQPVLIAGVPGSFFTLNIGLAAILSFPLALPYIGVPMGLLSHAVAAWLTRKDVHFFTILGRHLRQPQYWT